MYVTCLLILNVFSLLLSLLASKVFSSASFFLRWKSSCLYDICGKVCFSSVFFFFLINLLFPVLVVRRLKIENENNKTLVMKCMFFRLFCLFFCLYWLAMYSAPWLHLCWKSSSLYYVCGKVFIFLCVACSWRIFFSIS